MGHPVQRAVGRSRPRNVFQKSCEYVIIPNPPKNQSKCCEKGGENAQNTTTLMLFTNFAKRCRVGRFRTGVCFSRVSKLFYGANRPPTHTLALKQRLKSNRNPTTFPPPVWTLKTLTVLQSQPCAIDPRDRRECRHTSCLRSMVRIWSNVLIEGESPAWTQKTFSSTKAAKGR